MSERSEVTSFRSVDAQSRTDEILDWIEGIPLSKNLSRNLARDFSDAVLMSEILKFYYPQLVTAHNYITANSVQGKRDNWNVLNRKVLARIDMKLPPDTIEQLVHSQNGVIEKLLTDFHDKQMPADGKGCFGRIKSATDLSDATSSQLRMDLKKEQDEKRKSIISSALNSIANLFVGLFRIILAVICFWKWFSNNSKAKHIPEKNDKALTPDDRENEIRDAYLKSLEDLDRSYEAIKTLRHKVAFLEGTIKLKDAKIAGLQNDIDNRNNHSHRPSDVVQSARLSFDSSHRPFRRPRSQL